MIQFSSIVLDKEGRWTFSWVDTGADSYRVILEGNLLFVVTEPTVTISARGYVGEPPPIEVTEDDELALSEVNPPFLVLQWWPVPDAVTYNIQKRVIATWTSIGSLNENGEPILTFRTKIFPDEFDGDFRVIAMNSIRQESDPLEFVQLIVTPPKLKRVDTDIEYDEGTTSIVVTAP